MKSGDAKFMAAKRRNKFEDLHQRIAAEAQSLVGEIVDPIYEEYSFMAITTEPMLHPLGEMKEAIEARFADTSKSLGVNVAVTINDTALVTVFKGRGFEVTVTEHFEAMFWTDEDDRHGYELVEFGRTDVDQVVYPYAFGACIEWFTDQTQA
jgi:hypothetical protein